MDKDRYTETFETWNEVAGLYREKFMDLDIYNSSYDLFCNNIGKQRASILEIGCGPGNITQYLLTKRPDFSIHATDVAPNMLTLARQTIPSVYFEQLDCREIDKLQNRYEGIMSGFCLPYLSEEDVVKFVRDCSNLLLSKGMVYISFVEGDPLHSGYKAGSSGARTYFYYHRLEYLVRLLEQFAFEQIQVSEVVFNRSETEIEQHTILLARKK